MRHKENSRRVTRIRIRIVIVIVNIAGLEIDRAERGLRHRVC